jgi:hypothetical protein
MRCTRLLLLFALTAASASIFAAVSEEEAATLKTTLTPMGAERAGSADGSIPAWDGGYTAPFPGVVPGRARPDPFAAEKPLYSISAKNMAAHLGKLTEGTQALLSRFRNLPHRRLRVAPHGRGTGMGLPAQRDECARGKADRQLGGSHSARRLRRRSFPDTEKRRGGDLESHPALARREHRVGYRELHGHLEGAARPDLGRERREAAAVLLRGRRRGPVRRRVRRPSPGQRRTAEPLGRGVPGMGPPQSR